MRKLSQQELDRLHNRTPVVNEDSEENTEDLQEQDAGKKGKKGKKKVKDSGDGNKKSKKALIVVLLCFLALAGIYVFISLSFIGRFQFRTYVNDMSVTFASPSEVAYDYRRASSRLMFSFISKDGYTESVSLSKLGVTRSDDSSLLTLKQNPWCWPVSLFKPTQYTISDTLSYDDEELDKNIRKLECMDVVHTTMPRDAYVTVDEDRCVYYIVPEVEGNRPDVDKAIGLVKEALDKRVLSVDLGAEDCYFHPSLFSNDEVLNRVINECNEIVNLNIRLDLDADLVVTIPRDVMFRCVRRVGDTVTAQYDPIRQFVRSLAEQYNTVNKARKFNTVMDGTIRILPSNTDNFVGWDMDIEATLKIVNAMVRERESGKVEVIWKSVGKSHDQMNDFGNTYLELSIDRQMLWLHVNGVIVVSTPVTTGRDSDDRRTPVGMFKTLEFRRDFTMTGDGYTAFSHYFILVTADGVGIHDASWRSEYGGDEWVNNGSHGCINTPFDAVKEIFETLEARGAQSTPVIIY